MSCLLPKQNVGFKDSSTPRGDYLILLFICVLWDLHLCVFLGFQRRKSTIRCHQALLLLCSPPASCVHLMSMTPSLVWRMWPRLQCESHNSSSGSFILFIFLAYWKILASKYLLDTLCVFLEMDIVFMGVYSSLTLVVCRCVEILISEQFRRYTEKMQNIQELEYAEALAVNQLKLRRQNTVRENYKAKGSWNHTWVKNPLSII